MDTNSGAIILDEQLLSPAPENEIDFTRKTLVRSVKNSIKNVGCCVRSLVTKSRTCALSEMIDGMISQVDSVW